MTSPPVTPTATPRFQFPPPSPSVAPPRPPLKPLSRPQDEIGPSNSHEFSPSRVFTETPVSQPIQTPALDMLAGGAEPSLEPRYFPPGKKLAKKKALSGDDKLFIFDILNTFRRHWFLSVDNLWANALSAQKAVDGKISWVEFTPQFHAHLVKCAVALVPRPINKVKKESGKSGDAKGKGRTSACTRLDKPGPPNPPTAPSNMVTPLATTALQTVTMLKTKAPKKKKKQSAYKRPNTPSSAVEVASTGPTPLRTLVREFVSDQRSEGTSNRRSTWLNTEKKQRTRRGLMDSVT
ncbi:hypothetical protein BGW80DRAFT_1259880 [Lactifluus volemus]|nr:hypothetical protein BGW80DRAFT_1259880 [Lactifluus volemus]